MGRTSVFRGNSVLVFDEKTSEGIAIFSNCESMHKFDRKYYPEYREWTNEEIVNHIASITQHFSWMEGRVNNF